MSDWLKILKEYVDALESTLGAPDTAAATGAVSDVKEAMAYIKQLVTELIALDALVGAINATTTDSLHGKLGTDTELADYSLYDLLGGNAFKTNALSAMLGAFTSAQNLKAILGNLTTTKNLGGILGGLTTTDNLKAILGAYTAAANLKAAIDAIPTTMVGTNNAMLATSGARILCSMDFWSDPQEEVQVPAVAATLVLTPTVQVAERPAGATIVRVTAMFKFRMVENTYDGANALDGATDPDTSQVIQVKETTAGAYVDAINFADNQFTLDNLTREGGDVLIGSIDIAGEVDDNGNYTFQWKMRKCDSDFINFNDVQCGLRIWYSI